MKTGAGKLATAFRTDVSRPPVRDSAIVSKRRRLGKEKTVKKILALCIFTIVAAAPVGAQQSAGMGAMNYYVGTWACLAGSPSHPTTHATTTFVMNGGVLNQSVSVPAQTQMKRALSISLATSYDGKKGRYVQTYLNNTGAWSVSYANPWTGNTERWTDLSSMSGKLGHAQTVRTDHAHFTITGYPTLTGTTPNFKATCRRQSS